jgi:exopolysaccharide production protein ExoZ
MLMAGILPRTDPWRFLSHRIVRIYPLYVLLVAIWAVIGLATGAQKVDLHLLTLTLAPAGPHPWPLGPEWTLIYECSFYVALFALALAGLQKHLVPIACAWLAVIAAAQLLPGWNNPATYNVPVGPTILFKAPSLAFAGGLLVPTLARRAPVGLSVICVAVYFLFWPVTYTGQYVAASIAAIFIVLDVSRLRVSAPGLATLGDWSYALYLCHIPVFVVALKLALGAPLVAGLIVAFGAAAIFGTLDVWLYERLKTEIDRAADESRKRSVLGYLGVFCIAMLGALVIP